MIKNFYVMTALLLLMTGGGLTAADETKGGTADSKTSANYPEPIRQILQDFEQYAEKSMKEWHIPGMAIGIVSGDNVIYARAFGVKVIGDEDPVNLDTP
ncbi:MAG: hypothetical protein CK425_12505 [Parachlamydia sp.]|nr:MAG: hypothetical protein CK425_12505 [Parachlamydia sp.]